MAVIHFAALAYVGESNEDPAAYYRNNVGGTGALLEVMRDGHIVILYFRAHARSTARPRQSQSQSRARGAHQPVCASKMVCERMLRECATAFPLTFMALRYSMPRVPIPMAK